MNGVGGRARALYRAAALFYLALAIVGLVWIGSRRGRIGIDLFVDPPTIAVDLGAGVALAALLLGLWELGRRFSSTARDLERALAALVAPLTTGEAVALAIVSAVAEEIFFRGALQTAVGWLPTALLFALLHAGPRRAFRVWGLFALVAGVALGLWVLERERLGGAILAHALVNGVNLVRLSRRGGAPENSTD